jgi:hypothetical protein
LHWLIELVVLGAALLPVRVPAAPARLSPAAQQQVLEKVATMLFARDLTSRVYPQGGTTISFHLGSHHAEDPGQVALFAKLNRYHVEMLAYLVKKLDTIREGNGTLLDHSLILYGSNMGNSNQHLHYDAPHVLVGGAGGRLKVAVILASSAAPSRQAI